MLKHIKSPLILFVVVILMIAVYIVGSVFLYKVFEATTIQDINLLTEGLL